MSRETAKCPLCEGHGELSLSQLTERVTDEHLSEKLHSYLDAHSEEPVLVGAPSSPRTFDKDVHGWNPQLSMWRRSSKE